MSALGPTLVDGLRRQLGERPEILEAYLFGSHASGLARPHSDVDVAVYVDPACTRAAPFGYEAELTAELQTFLGRNDVDVVVLNRASPLLYHRVLRDGVRLFTREAMATTTREGRALSRYCDYLPQLRKIDSAHRERIEGGDLGR
jgi:predicted nucleotidyltransferase